MDRTRVVTLLGLLLAACAPEPAGESGGDGADGGEGGACAVVCGPEQAVDPIACACVAICGEVACRPGERCDGSSCVCTDESCAEGERCDAATGACVPDGCTCADGSACAADGSCPAVCDPACAPGETCGGEPAACSCDPAADACGDGRLCDPRLRRCVDGCPGGCPEDLACAGTPPRCLPACDAVDCAGLRCDPRSGACVEDLCTTVRCGAGEVCDPATGSCGPDACDGAGCAAGEACDPLVGLCRCDPAALGCAPGSGCDPETFRCTTSDLPTEFDGCTEAVGCAPGLVCTTLPAQAPLCLEPCETTSDCRTLFAYCEPSVGACLPNGCGQGSFRQPNVPWFGACEGEAAGSGVCVPLEDGEGGVFGLCFDGGTAASGGPCADDQHRGDPETACPRGEFCLIGTCGAYCDPADAASCGPGLGCFEFQGEPEPWGVCATFGPCASVECADGLVCDPVDEVCKDACGNRCDAGERCNPDTRACETVGCGGGCPAGEVCSGEVCEPFLCRGVVCRDGARCDPATGVCEGGCDACPEQTYCDEGTCARVAMCAVCEQGETCDPATGLCVTPPLPGARCEPRVGCGRGLCVEVDGSYVCTDPCAFPGDCADPGARCLEGACVPGWCGPSTPAGGGFYEPCDDGGNGGTCVPRLVDGGKVGLCLAGGHVGEGGACDPGADRSTPDSLCAVLLACEPGNDGGASCLPLCDPFGSLLACAEGACEAQPEHHGVCR